MESRPDKRDQLAWTAGALAAALPAMAVADFLGHLSIETGAGLAFLGALIASAIHSGDAAARSIHAVSYLAGVLGAFAATIFYLQERSSIVNLEVILPLVGGGLPGVALYWILSRTRRRLAR